MPRSLLMGPPPQTSRFKPAAAVASRKPLNTGPAWINEDAPYFRMVGNVFLHPMKTLDYIPAHLANPVRFGIAAATFVVSTLLLAAVFSNVSDPDVRAFFTRWANVDDGSVIMHLLGTTIALAVSSVATALLGHLLSRGGSIVGTFSTFMWIEGITTTLWAVAAFMPAPVALLLGSVIAIWSIIVYYSALMSLFDLSLVEAIFASIIVTAMTMAVGLGIMMWVRSM